MLPLLADENFHNNIVVVFVGAPTTPISSASKTLGCPGPTIRQCWSGPLSISGYCSRMM